MSVTISITVTAPYCFLFSASSFLAITLLEMLGGGQYEMSYEGKHETI